jgi:osmoprotectant transport system permease protein
MSLYEFIARNWRDLLTLVGEHLWLVARAMVCAVFIALPVGVLLTRRKGWQRPVLGLASILQTVPSLALFGFLIPLPFGGIGPRSAVIALVLYALLPLLRNTVAGIEGVDRSVREAAVAMGMTARQILWQVELPLAAPVILAGVRVATVISVGVATIAAAIGAGGLGTYIFRGLRQYDNTLILAGAIPAALMALAADWLIGRLETIVGTQTGTRAHAASDKRARLRRRVLITATALVFVACVVAFVTWRGGRREAGGTTQASAPVVVCSKDFTESVLLAELLAQELAAQGAPVARKFELGGNLCHDALVAGQVDVYPEYTGTSYTAILKHQPVTDPRAVYDQVKREYAEKFAVETGPPLGFRNDFAILVRGRDARALSLRTISDAVPHARAWRAGFGQDFMSRADGYPGFARAYDLHFAAPPREMDLALTYRALAEGQVDMIAGNSTDGLVSALDLVQLEDDRHYFPPYEAVYLARRAALDASPALQHALERLGGALSTEEMRRLNYEVDGRKRAVADVVRAWRQGKGL